MKKISFLLCLCLAFIALTILSLPVHAQIEGALATLQAVTYQAQQSQWDRYINATRRAQSLEATRDAEKSYLEATKQISQVHVQATERAYSNAANATATRYVMEAQYQATSNAVSVEVTRQAAILDREKAQRYSNVLIATLWLTITFSIILLLVVIAKVLHLHYQRHKHVPVVTIDSTYTTLPLLSAGQATVVTVSVLPDYSDIIDNLVSSPGEE